MGSEMCIRDRQIHINLPPKHPIMSLETIEINMAAVSAKRSIIFYHVANVEERILGLKLV